LGFTHRARVAPQSVSESPAVRTRTHLEWPEYLREVCELLWPPPAVITLDTAPSAWPSLVGGIRQAPPHPDLPRVSEFLLIPGVHRPPLVVPAQRRLAAAAIRHYRPPRALSARLAGRALSFGLASGLGGAMVRGRFRVSEPEESDTIESYLREAVSREIRVSMYLGPARANRKPVLQLLAPSGEAVGYAKIGINPLTQELVRAEHDTLSRVSAAGLTAVRAPAVLHHGSWRGLDVLVLSTLPVWLRRRQPPTDQLCAAMGEVARMCGGLRTAPLRDSGYLAALRTRLADADNSQPKAALLGALDALTKRSGEVVMTYGAWHGDWSPWNMACTQSGLLLWDWERFSTDAPLGFDALHHWMQGQVRPSGRDPHEVAADCPEHAVKLIEPFGIGAEAARVTGLLYMAELATRYLVDRQDKAGARLGAAGDWLIPAIAAGVRRP
jgi:hypothetical protein